jgi:nucleotide-binding universal stress UspA family protein
MSRRIHPHKPKLAESQLVIRICLPRQEDFAMDVLLPFDGSPSAQRALDYLIALAERLGKGALKAHVLNVQESSHGIGEAFGRDAADVAARLTEAGRAAGSRLLAPVVERLAAADIPSEPVVLIGDPPLIIAEYADDHRCDAIVMGTRGLGPVSGVVLGSVASKVVHLVKVPVTLVK